MALSTIVRPRARIEQVVVDPEQGPRLWPSTVFRRQRCSFTHVRTLTRFQEWFETSPRPAGPAGVAVRPRIAFAVASLATAAFLSSGMQAGVRLASEELPAIQIAFIRTAITCAVLAPLLFLPRNRSAWRSRRPRLQVIRGILGAISLVLWFHALTVIPLAEAVALSFTLSIFVTAGAALFLRERVGPRRWSAVAAGILGALIILRPGLVEMSWGAIEVILSCALLSVTILTAKRIAPYDSNLTIVLYMATVSSLLLAIPVLATWVNPSPRIALIAVGLGVLSAVVGLLIANGIRYADVSLTQPVGFTRMIWAALIGYALFDETPDAYTWLGAAVILGSALYISYREAQLSRKQKSTA